MKKQQLHFTDKLKSSLTGRCDLKNVGFADVSGLEVGWRHWSGEWVFIHGSILEGFAVALSFHLFVLALNL